MKTKYFLLVLVLSSYSFGLQGQIQTINTAKSSVSWLGKKITGQHEGEIKIKSGSLEIKNNKISSGNFVIDMNSISCSDLEDEGYNQKLVNHLKSDDFFGIGKFPNAILKINNSSTFLNNVASVKGQITIKGKTEDISFDVTNEKNTYSAKIEIDRSKFNVRYGSTSFFDTLGDKAIDDIFTLNIKLLTNN